MRKKFSKFWDLSGSLGLVRVDLLGSQTKKLWISKKMYWRSALGISWLLQEEYKK